MTIQQDDTRDGAAGSTFTVVAEVPAGVSLGEFASHLADAHRLAVAGYHPSDPMAGMGEIGVFGSVWSADLPATA